MRYVAAYLLANLAGAEPDLKQIEKILSSVGIETDKDKANKVIAELKGKKIDDLIKEGSTKLATVSAAAPAAAAPAAGKAAAAAPAAAAAKPAESKSFAGFSLQFQATHFLLAFEPKNFYRKFKFGFFFLNKNVRHFMSG